MRANADALARPLEMILATDREKVARYVGRLRASSSHLDELGLARAIVGRKSLKCGLVGAITGVGGLGTLPVSVPADLIASWRIQAAMVTAVATVFGHGLSDEELMTDIIILMGANQAKDALKHVGIEAGKELTRKMVARYMTRQMMKRIWRVVGYKVLTKAGQKSLTSITRLIPLVGAPIGFGFDYVAARAVGGLAIHYYS